MVERRGGRTEVASIPTFPLSVCNVFIGRESFRSDGAKLEDSDGDVMTITGVEV
jgi:hypothetical protein